ncbi:MAG: TIGR03986 family CRISPR-associated RAMP protein [Chloroflexota bacterium]
MELPDDVLPAPTLSSDECVKTYTEGNEQEHLHLVRHDCYFPQRYTGYITATLVADSPIYIRTGLDTDIFPNIGEKPFDTLDDEQKTYYAQFFTLCERLAIPGSSLRGMIRSLVEIVSHSKITRVTKRQPFFRTLADQTMKKDYSDSFVQKYGDVQRVPHPRAPCYGTSAHTGFLVRSSSGKYVIEECESGRIKRSQIPETNGMTEDLYDRRGAFRTPKWKYQHRRIYVNLDTVNDHFFPKNPRHLDMYLRYRAVTQASFQQTQETPQEGVLVLTGHMPDKKMEFVFLHDTLTTHRVDEAIIDRFHDDDQISQWQERAFCKDQPQSNCRKRDGMLRDGEREPVFFLLSPDGKVRFFGRAQNFRLPYLHAPYDFVPSDLRDPAITDLAEVIFGYVPTDDGERQDKRPSYAGRVFIDDAFLTSPVKYLNEEKPYLTPRILASPKPTTFQHYLVQEDEQPNNLMHYGKTPNQDTVIRGHKLYWHQEQSRQYISETWVKRISETDHQRIEKAPKQYTRIRPLAPGASFQAYIRFENLSNIELGVLLWTLNLASKPSYRFKLGMGKPLGMGSIRFDNIQVIHSERQIRYASLFDTDANWITGDKEMSASLQDHCITAFQQYVMKHYGLQDVEFDELPRIQMLRCLLAWPGPGYDQTYTPAQDSTRYMEIERQRKKGCISDKLKNKRDTVNEYVNRPVLPGPWQVLGYEPPPCLPAPKKESSTPEPVQITPDQYGVIQTLATDDQVGYVEDVDGNRYPYQVNHVAADVSLEDRQRITFRVEKRKISEGSGKKRRNKRRDCAVEIQPVKWIESKKMEST